MLNFLLFLDGYSDSESPQIIEFPNNTVIRFVACGFFHCAAISSDNSVFTWGIGTDGQLGHGENLNLTSPRRISSFYKRKNDIDLHSNDEGRLNSN
jgi:alpha-tubulin suppressor-like RCC1 family protein